MVCSLLESEYHNCLVLCKGFRVNNAKLFDDYGYNMIPDIVDYWGGDTKSILNVSRDKLSQEQMANNKVIFSQARDYRAEVYYSILSVLLEDNDIKEWHNDISEFMKGWMSKKTNDVEIPNLAENIITMLDRYKNLMHSKMKYSI